MPNMYKTSRGSSSRRVRSYTGPLASTSDDPVLSAVTAAPLVSPCDTKDDAASETESISTPLSHRHQDPPQASPPLPPPPLPNDIPTPPPSATLPPIHLIAKGKNIKTRSFMYICALFLLALLQFYFFSLFLCFFFVIFG